MSRARSGLFAVAVSFVVAWSAAAEPAKSLLLRGTIVSMVPGSKAKKGAVHVQDGKIVAVLGPTAKAPEGATVVDTKGFIYPGLLNLHNHIAYNFLPLYSVPKHYTNRDQWPGGVLYEKCVNNPKNIVTDLFDAQTQVLKYAEVKAIAGGETAIQGSPADAGTSSLLVRNVEQKNFGKDKVGCRGLTLDAMFVKDLAKNQDSIAKLDAWIFHLAEGIDDYSRREYSNPAFDKSKNPGPKNQAGLKELGLVTKQLVGIHCTGLTENDFADWRATVGEGAKVVWSPLSNLLLYGKTTDVPAAKKHGALVALGTDWSPSGSKNLLWELKVADQVDKQIFKNRLSDEDLVAMVTRNPAAMIGWSDYVGMIKPGMVADLLVVDDLSASSSWRNLIEAREENVQMVLVDGQVVYGDAPLLKRLKIDHEVLPEKPSKTRSKAIVIKSAKAPEGDESFADVRDEILAACAMNPTALAKKLNKPGKDPKDPYHARSQITNWLGAAYARRGSVPESMNDPALSKQEAADYMKLKYPHAEPVQAIDSIYQSTDDAYFSALEANLHFTGANTVFDARALQLYRK